MECVHCGENGFNRAIVGLDAGSDVELLCEDCETATYGRVLRQPLWQHEDGCVLCPSDGDYALPLVECLIEPDGVVEYDLTDATPLLCTAHAHAIHPVATPERTAASQTV